MGFEPATKPSGPNAAALKHSTTLTGDELCFLKVSHNHGIRIKSTRGQNVSNRQIRRGIKFHSDPVCNVLIVLYEMFEMTLMVTLLTASFFPVQETDYACVYMPVFFLGENFFACGYIPFLFLDENYIFDSVSKCLLQSPSSFFDIEGIFENETKSPLIYPVVPSLKIVFCSCISRIYLKKK